MRARSSRGAARRDRIEPAELLQRSGRGADIFERGLRHDTALVGAPVIAELGKRPVDFGVVAGGGETKPGVPARVHLSEAVNQRDRPSPRALVHRGVESELGEIERCRLQRQWHIDVGMALVDRKPDIDAGRDARAEPGDAATGPALVADEVADLAGPGRNSVGLAPGPEARRLGALRGAAAGRIAPESLAETGRRLIAETLQEIAAEVGHGFAGRHIGIDHGRCRTGGR